MADQTDETKTTTEPVPDDGSGTTESPSGTTTTDSKADAKAQRDAARAEKAEAAKERRRERMERSSAVVADARTRVAQVVWILCVIAALLLAIGALCIALKANGSNSLVKFVIDTAGKLDFGVFSRKSGVFHFKGHNHSAMTKNALVNWGLAAVVWLVIGRILDRIIRP